MNLPTSLSGALPRSSNRKALLFAWAVEALAVGMGLILAAYAGYEGGENGFIAKAIAMP
jgi:hypothetical protein